MERNYVTVTPCVLFKSTLFDAMIAQILDLGPEREACIDFHLNRVPPQLGNLINLRVLMLDTNQLSELPPEISRLQHLQRLSVSNNHLRCLPETISNLKHLESVHAANNRCVHCTSSNR